MWRIAVVGFAMQLTTAGDSKVQMLLLVAIKPQLTRY
jgi:hypothetical protein